MERSAPGDELPRIKDFRWHVHDKGFSWHFYQATWHCNWCEYWIVSLAELAIGKTSKKDLRKIIKAHPDKICKFVSIGKIRSHSLTNIKMQKTGAGDCTFAETLARVSSGAFDGSRAHECKTV
jgi:hypothetical protein